METLRNRIDARLLSNEKDYLNASPNQAIFCAKYLTMTKSRKDNT